MGLAADKIYSVRNGLQLCEAIEEAFDRQRVCFIYDALQSKFYFRVLDSQLRRLPAKPSSLTFGELDGRPLSLPHGKMPYRRVLRCMHAREALHHAETECEFETTDEDRRAVEQALNLSDRVSHDEDERERIEEMLDESPVIGSSDEDSGDTGFDFTR